MCPTERCETGGCPECRTQCKPPTCSPRCSAPPVSWGALMAGAALFRTPAPCLPLARQAPSCNILCDEPKCEAPRDRLCRDAAARLTLLVSPPPAAGAWKCRQPEACPRPKCDMVCEAAPGCPGSTGPNGLRVPFPPARQRPPPAIDLAALGIAPPDKPVGQLGIAFPGVEPPAPAPSLAGLTAPSPVSPTPTPTSTQTPSSTTSETQTQAATATATQTLTPGLGTAAPGL